MNASSCSAEVYKQEVSLVAEMHAFFVATAAMTLFTVLYGCRKLNWTIGFLFLNAFVVLLREAITVGVSFMKPGTAPWPHALLLGECIKALGDPFRSIYLYQRCSPLFRSITHSSKKRRYIRLTFFFLIAVDVIAQGFHYFSGGAYILWTDGVTYVWVNRRYDLTARVIALWADNFVDLFSCGIIVTSLLGKYNSKRATENRNHNKILLILKSSEFRICYVFLLGIARTVLVFIFPGGDYGTLEYSYSILAQKYALALFLIFLLIDSALVRLFPVNNEQPKSQLSASGHMRSDRFMDGSRRVMTNVGAAQSLLEGSASSNGTEKPSPRARTIDLGFSTATDINGGHIALDVHQDEGDMPPPIPMKEPPLVHTRHVDDTTGEFTRREFNLKL